MTSLPDPLPCATTKVIGLLGKLSAQTDAEIKIDEQRTDFKNMRKNEKYITVSLVNLYPKLTQSGKG